MVSGLKDVLVEMDARVFNQSLEELFELFFLQWLENADKDLELLIDGSPVRISKEDIVPNPKFRVVATFARTNRQYQRQQALQRFELFKGDPFIDQYALRKQALMLDGDGMVDKLLRKEDEILRQVRLESLLGDEKLKNAHRNTERERSGNGTQS